MRANFRMIFDLLDRRERTKAIGLTGLVVLMGLLDVLGVASVLPFLGVVANPGLIESNAALAWAHSATGSPSERTFLILLGLGAFLFVLFAALFRAGTFYALSYFTRMCVPSLSIRLMGHYLAQPYAWFLNRHSADLGKSILSEVGNVVNGPIEASVRLVAHGVMLTTLVLFLLVLQPYAALGSVVLFGGSYGLIYLFASGPLSRMGTQSIGSNRDRFQILQEAMTGIKQVKLRGLERAYLERFRLPAEIQARNQAALSVISELPRQLLEVIAFGGMILFVLWLLLTREGGLAGIVPILGVYAFAAARLFPTIQQLFAAVSRIRFGQPALIQLHSELSGTSTQTPAGDDAGPAIPLRRCLELDEVSFTFAGAAQPALNRLTLRIDARTTVGIVGTTGAGKTTTVDLILGLLHPDSGTLRVDGRPVLRNSIRDWQKSVGYVPQEIFLVDDTIAANIAFGTPSRAIDRAAVETAARVASLHDFVESSLPDGYDTVIGERGARLSGGQRQRIGIARALYTDPDVLVFDEATSALDSVTERAVMDAVRRLGHRKTVIMIAHRLSTVRDCDKIFLMEQGRVVGEGTYGELRSRHEGFRAMVGGDA
ncbi:ABC transporter ATP-binding protein [Wenxinia saemankumensis]|uniref:ABC-type bacteriocin/lantibiotic exporter, contains an N-terminal double-glycine peptidase domain n=1 Tax=Wenxinia saemankumensis TaxID=1447782 RepID=A0A1M5ZYI4_9RHOB|nr:ABC transporter ATP-binding protein [Wenxinia saemankumensis]SHI29300.1 ABC-type bacteriocin/lantibiotic exporter, contains an N-terminal double-glycine peptidase domain [Wenxinia saemankumensis]